MDKQMEKYVGAGIGLGVLFLVLQVIAALFTGTLGSNWTTALNSASSFVGVALIILMYEIVTHIGK